MNQTFKNKILATVYVYCIFISGFWIGDYINNRHGLERYFGGISAFVLLTCIIVLFIINPIINKYTNGNKRKG